MKQFLVSALVVFLGQACHLQPQQVDVPYCTRIVSLAPSITELLFELQGEQLLVAVSRYDKHPKLPAHMAVVGGLIDPELETIAHLKPDCVWYASAGGVTMKQLLPLKRLGIHLQDFPMENFEQMNNALWEIGKKIKKQKRAQELRARWDADKIKFRQWISSHSSLRHVHAIILYGDHPLVAAGKNSFGVQLLTMAGITNSYQGDVAYPVISKEWLVSQQPAVIFDAIVGKQYQEKHVRSKIITMSDEALLHPGPTSILSWCKLLSKHFFHTACPLEKKDK